MTPDEIKNILSSNLYLTSVSTLDAQEMIEVVITSPQGKIARLVVQDLETPEVDVYIGDKESVEVYYSSGSKKDFLNYLDLLKKDLELLSANYEDISILEFKLLGISKKVLGLGSHSVETNILRRATKRPIWAPFAKVKTYPF